MGKAVRATLTTQLWFASSIALACLANGAAAQPSAAFPEEDPEPPPARSMQPEAPRTPAPAPLRQSPNVVAPGPSSNPVAPRPVAPRAVAPQAIAPPPVAPRAGSVPSSAPRPLPPPLVQPDASVATPGAGFLPAALPVYGNLPAPPGYVLEERVNTGLVIGGAVTWGAMYAVSLGYAGSRGFDDGMGVVAVPLLGPWIAIGQRDFSCDFGLTTQAITQCQQKTIDQATTVIVLAGLGLGQMVGAALTVIGLLDSESLWVRSDLLNARWTLDAAPTVGGGELMMRGAF